MADRKDDESDRERDDEQDESEPEGKASPAASDDDDETSSKADADEDTEGDDAEDEGDAKASGDAAPEEDDTSDDADKAARSTDGDADEEEEILPGQLGTQRYIFAAFFGGIIVTGYVFGKLIHGVWGWASNREWFYGRMPSLAAVPDDSKTTYGLVIGSFIALVLGIRTYRKPDVRRWTDEVTAEMTKVKWPTRKEVYASTVVVIAGSLIACAYLFLLDQFWSFVTGLVYGTGS